MRHSFLAIFALLTAPLLPAVATAAPGLVNPAAAHCVESGGFYGIQDGAGGKVGMCRLPDGSEADAWAYFREAGMKDMKLANPAAVHCIRAGGTHDVQNGTCTLPDGQVVDAWDYLRAAHAGQVQLANPAAMFCIEQGGTYRIEATDQGSVSFCTKADGTEEDAWAFFGANAKTE